MKARRCSLPPSTGYSPINILKISTDHIHLTVHIFLELFTLDQCSVAVPLNKIFFRMLLNKELQLLVPNPEILRSLIQR